MKLVNKVLKVLLLLLGGVFIMCQGFGFDVNGAAVCLAMLVLLVILYSTGTVKIQRNKYFFAFLIVFTIAQLINFIGYIVPAVKEGEIDFYYYCSNILFIISYLLLVVKILRDLNFREVFSELAIPIMILVILDVFCVVLVSDTAKASLNYYQFALEFTYNAVIMALLSAALINYMYRNDNKSMLFLVASICIVFSEIIQLAYYYVLKDKNLGFIYSFFLFVAFLCFYLQSQLKFTGPIPAYIDEQLEI